jgi:hypothetical protein
VVAGGGGVMVNGHSAAQLSVKLNLEIEVEGRLRFRARPVRTVLML